jgi:hypothetical protein
MAWHGKMTPACGREYLRHAAETLKRQIKGDPSTIEWTATAFRRHEQREPGLHGPALRTQCLFRVQAV